MPHAKRLSIWVAAMVLGFGAALGGIVYSAQQINAPAGNLVATSNSPDDDGTADRGPGCCEAEDRNASSDDGTADRGPACCEPGDHDRGENSGHGSGEGDDDNSGPGSGDDDNSGPSSNSGPGSLRDDDEDEDDGDDDFDDDTNTGSGNSGSGWGSPALRKGVLWGPLVVPG